MISSEESLPGALRGPCHSTVGTPGEAITAHSSWHLDANVTKMKGESIGKAEMRASWGPSWGYKDRCHLGFPASVGTFELAEQVLPV